MYKRNIKVKQLDKTDCGAACLSSICAYYGLQFPIARIRQYAFTNQRGTNILGLIKAAEKLNLFAKGVKATFESLYVIPKPTIAHVLIDGKNKHYIVLLKINKRKKNIIYMDPADGQIHRMKYEDFIHIWTNILVVIEPKKTFKSNCVGTSITQKFISLLMPHKNVMIQAILGAVIYSLLGISTAVYVGKITDYVWVDSNVNLLNLMSVIMIFILLIRTLIGSMKGL